MGRLAGFSYREVARRLRTPKQSTQKQQQEPHQEARVPDETPAPPPFVVGQVYEDEKGEYRVLSVEGTRITFEYLHGAIKHSDNIALKASIHNRRIRERQHPGPLPYQPPKSGTAIAEYSYEVVTPLVAQIIQKHAEHSSAFLRHAGLKERLLADPHARSIIENLPRTGKFTTPEAWAGVIIAGFSKEWTEGRWPRFERKKISNGHAWRLKRK